MFLYELTNLKSNFYRFFIPKSAIESQRVHLNDDTNGIYEMVILTMPFRNFRHSNYDLFYFKLVYFFFLSRHLTNVITPSISKRFFNSKVLSLCCVIVVFNLPVNFYMWFALEYKKCSVSEIFKKLCRYNKFLDSF